MGLNNDFLHLRAWIKFFLSLSTFTLTLFRVTAANIPISRLLSHRDIFLRRHRVFFSGFGARKYWKYSVSLPFALLSYVEATLFGSQNIFFPLANLERFIFFPGLPHLFSQFPRKHTSNAHSPWFFSFSSSSHHWRILFLADWELLAMTEVKFWKWKGKARLEWLWHGIRLPSLV